MSRTLRVFACLTLAIAAIAADEKEKKPPEKLVFHSKAGDVPFSHAEHVKREKGDCTVCHDKLWPQSSQVPLKGSTGCRTCHHPGGKSFETKTNCERCHPGGVKKS
jgi:c(7)-type cytochrome triheme protein